MTNTTELITNRLTAIPITEPVADTVVCNLLRLPHVESLLGIKKSKIYAEMKAGTFPLPLSLGGKIVAWKASDIASWIENLPIANHLGGK